MDKQQLSEYVKKYVKKQLMKESLRVSKGPLKLGGSVHKTEGKYMDPDTKDWYVVVDDFSGNYIGPFKSMADASDAEVKFSALDYSTRQKMYR